MTAADRPDLDVRIHLSSETIVEIDEKLRHNF